MRVFLLDSLGYQVHEVILPDALPHVIVWGSKAYLKISKRKYKETTLYVLADTQ